jgi:hypothetical protein
LLSQWDPGGSVPQPDLGHRFRLLYLDLRFLEEVELRGHFYHPLLSMILGMSSPLEFG